MVVAKLEWQQIWVLQHERLLLFDVLRKHTVSRCHPFDVDENHESCEATPEELRELVRQMQVHLYHCLTRL